jgi:hypothetical protein
MFLGTGAKRAKTAAAQPIPLESPPLGTPTPSYLAYPLPYIDPFTGATSLDGRNGRPCLISCKCGLPTAVKTSSTPGPNYGRPYASCRNHPSSIPFYLRNSGGGAQPHCNSFSWLNGAPHLPSSLSALYFPLLPRFKLWNSAGPSPADISQGSLGDCWFLSALSCISTHPNLIRRIFSNPPRDNLLELTFFINGRFQSTIIDSFVPCKILTKTPKTTKGGLQYRPIVVDSSDLKTPVPPNTPANVTVHPLYAFPTNSAAWVPLIEKAYAKFHNSYGALSGGEIWEALMDLLGCTVEVISLDANNIDRDLLWSRLLSSLSANFVIGAACMVSDRENDLVGCHAYSVLEAREVYDVTVGKQTKIGEFFTSEGDDDDGDVVCLGDNSLLNAASLRLVKLRNPWGCKEFSGAFGAQSEQWTTKLRALLGNTAFGKNAGCGEFWMRFDDFISKFSCVDVGKVRNDDWIQQSHPNSWITDAAVPTALGCSFSPSTTFYIIECIESATEIEIMTNQQKKRGCRDFSFWYVDVLILVLKRKRGDDAEEWQGVCLAAGGETRINSLEFFTEPQFQYAVGFYSTRGNAEQFYSSVYSSRQIKREIVSSVEVVVSSQAWLGAVHNPREAPSVHRLAKNAALIIVSSSACNFFVASNASSVPLLIDLSFAGTGFKILSEAGGTMSCGRNKAEGDTVTREMAKVCIPPRCEMIVGGIIATRGAVSLTYEFFASKGEGAEGQTKSFRISRAGEKVCQRFSGAIPDDGGFEMGRGDILRANTDGVGRGL